MPVTVMLIRKGLGLLRQVAATSEERTKTVVLYRGMQGVRVTEQFMDGGDGGTELAPMSTMGRTGSFGGFGPVGRFLASIRFV